MRPFSWPEFVTYDVELLRNNLGADNVERAARRERVIQAINKSSADVICLQEVWYESDMRQVCEARSGLS